MVMEKVGEKVMMLVSLSTAMTDEQILELASEHLYCNMSVNETTMTNLSKLAATATKLDLAIAEAQGQIKFTKLPAAKPKRNQLVYTSGTVLAGQGSGRSQKVG
jgi:hypothetical protein